MLELNLTKLPSFQICYFGAFLHFRYGTLYLSPLYSFQWIFFKLCRHIVNLMKMSMQVFEGVRINFDRTTISLNL